MKLLILTSLATLTGLIASPALAGEVSAAVEPAAAADPFVDRLLGNWGGARTSLLDHGITVDFDAWYHLQGIMSGGRETGNDVGNLFTGRFNLNLDTGKAGLWDGGFFSLRVQSRGGDSVLGSDGTTSPTNSAALLPLVPGRLGESAWALNEVTFTQFFSPKFALIGGLINTDAGDANPIAGTLGSDSYFMNTGLQYSPVVMSTIPTTTLGGGAIFLPSENVIGSIMVLGTNETAGINPFDNYEGTTFSSEWTYKKPEAIGGLPGGMTLGGTYSINQDRFPVTQDPRVLLTDIATGGSPTTDDEAWSIYWNGYQYLRGDEAHGWGLFGRLGFSDGDPTPIAFHAAGGVGGVGLLPSRENDRWGLGAFYQEFTDKGLIAEAGIEDELGGELFYNVQLTPATNLTFDLQVIDSALPNVDTTVVGAVRFGVRF